MRWPRLKALKFALSLAAEVYTLLSEHFRKGTPLPSAALTGQAAAIKAAAYKAKADAEEHLRAAQVDAASVAALGPHGPNPASGQPHYTESIAPGWAKSIRIAYPRRPSTGALAYQVGGSHYKNLPIQPVEYSTKNNLGWIEGNIVKHITRHNLDGGKGAQDIQKAAHYCRLLLQLAYEQEQDGIMPYQRQAEILKGTITDPLAGEKIEDDFPDKQNRREIAREIVLNWYGGRLDALLQRFANAFDVIIAVMPSSEDDPLCIYCGRPKSCHDEADDFEPVEPERNRVIAQVRELALRWTGHNSQDFLKLLTTTIYPARVVPTGKDAEMPDSDLEDVDTDTEDGDPEEAHQIEEGELVVIKYLYDNFYLDTVGKINKIVNCARCGHEHDNLPYLPLRNGPGGLTHWAICPTTGEPIMVMRQIEIGTAAEDSPEGDGEVKVKMETPTEKITQY